MSTFLHLGGGGKIKKVSLGNYGVGTHNVNVGQLFAGIRNYKLFTMDNFSISADWYVEIQRQGAESVRCYVDVNGISYNASTGILTFTIRFVNTGAQHAGLRALRVPVFIFYV